MENTPVQPSSPKNILIIEDEYFISELYIRALEKAGYQVTLATDGADGLKQALSDTFDIILLDLMMPTVTGNEILEKLRGPDATTSVRAKIIVTTNLEQSEERKSDVENQADAYLIKAEITPKELVAFIETLDAGQQSAAANS